MKAIIIAGTHSGVGKTTITLGILGALYKRGIMPQAFKVGPDFIDPTLHELITGRRGENIDSWMFSEGEVRRIFNKCLAHSQIGIIEGAMGLFDGAPSPHLPQDTANNPCDYAYNAPPLGSTAHIAQILSAPVVLVINAHGMGRSALPLIKGFCDFNPNVMIKGIIFNNVGSIHHIKYLKKCVYEMMPQLTVLGGIPREEAIKIPSRHLGLHMGQHIQGDARDDLLDKITSIIEQHIDINKLLSISSLSCNQPSEAGDITHTDITEVTDKYDVTIGIPLDNAFCFYYQENLDILKRLGARLAFFSPISDKRLPKIDALYIGGGYPELYAKELSKNINMLKEIREKLSFGMPCYGECGGMMYLSKGIYKDNEFFPMAGALPFEIKMDTRLSSLGYREVSLKDDCIIGGAKEVARGHEFHYSQIVNRDDIEKDSIRDAYVARDAMGRRRGDTGIVKGKIVASYVHIHFLSNINIARTFLRNAQYFKTRRK